MLRSLRILTPRISALIIESPLAAARNRRDRVKLWLRESVFKTLAIDLVNRSGRWADIPGRPSAPVRAVRCATPVVFASAISLVCLYISP